MKLKMTLFLTAILCVCTSPTAYSADLLTQAEKDGINKVVRLIDNASDPTRIRRFFYGLYMIGFMKGSALTVPHEDIKDCLSTFANPGDFNNSSLTGDHTLQEIIDNTQTIQIIPTSKSSVDVHIFTVAGKELSVVKPNTTVLSVGEVDKEVSIRNGTKLSIHLPTSSEIIDVVTQPGQKGALGTLSGIAALWGGKGVTDADVNMVPPALISGIENYLRTFSQTVLFPLYMEAENMHVITWIKNKNGKAEADHDLDFKNSVFLPDYHVEIEKEHRATNFPMVGTLEGVNKALGFTVNTAIVKFIN